MNLFNIEQARRKQIKSEGAKFLLSKWKYHFSKFQSESKKNLKERGGGVMLLLSLFGTFNTQEILGVYVWRINVI